MKRLIIVICLLALPAVALSQDGDPPPTLPAAATFTPTPAAPGSLGIYEPNLDSDDSPDFVPEVRSYSWSVPNMPALSTATPYQTPMPDASEQARQNDLNNLAATLDAFQTPQALSNPDGSIFDQEATIEELENWLLLLFSYLKGLDPDDFGNMAPLIRFTVLSFLLMITVKSVLIFIPIFAAVGGFIRKMWEAIPGN